MENVKVATCCYCGTKAALVLKGAKRHELACGTCGAPLSRMKMLPQSDDTRHQRAAPPSRKSDRKGSHARWTGHDVSHKKGKKRKSLKRRVLSEIWDVVEDIFD